MKRRWFAVVGAVVVLGVATLATVLEAAVATSPVSAALAVGGACFVLGGLDPVPDRVAWYRFVGVGELLVGGTFGVTLLAPVVAGDRTAAAVLLGAAGVANVVLFAFIGLDWLRGSRHFDLSRFEPGPILGG